MTLKELIGAEEYKKLQQEIKRPLKLKSTGYWWAEALNKSEDDLVFAFIQAPDFETAEAIYQSDALLQEGLKHFSDPGISIVDAKTANKLLKEMTKEELDRLKERKIVRLC